MRENTKREPETMGGIEMFCWNDIGRNIFVGMIIALEIKNKLLIVLRY